jgi:hypothetical protein
MGRKSKKQIGREAIAQYLKENSDTQYIMLYTLSVVADNAAGKELFDYDYEDILPPGCKVKWIDADDLDEPTLARSLGGRFLVVENPYYPYYRSRAVRKV